MELIAVIFAISLIAVLLAWVTKIDIAFLFAPSIFFIAFWEFVFGLSGFLNLGMETLVLSVGLVLLFGVIRSRKFRIHLISNSFAPSTVAFVSLSLISLYKSKDWVLSQWDEFSHWGHVVKIMYEYGALGPSTPTDYTAEEYPPAISLFQYFVMDFNFGWREGLLFWATHLIVISIIVSVLAKSSYKYLSEIALKLFVGLAASSVFFDNFGTIYSDPVLALAFGFLIVVAIQTSCLDGKWAVLLALTAGFVTMTKPTGIYFAAAAILINIVATLFTTKLIPGRKMFLAFTPALVAILTVGSCWTTWRYYVNSFSTSNIETSEAVRNGFNATTNRDEVIANFVNAFFDRFLNPSYSASLPSLHWAIICGIFFAIWAGLNDRSRRKRNLAIGITLSLTTAGYFLAILISYLTVFSPGEATNLASYERYIGSWFQGIFFAILTLILSEFSLSRYFDSKSYPVDEPHSLLTRRHVSLFLVAFLGLVSFSSIMHPIILLRAEQFKGSQYREPFIPMVKTIKAAKIPDGSKVYIITQHTIGFEYYVLRYEMIGAQFGKNAFSIGTQNGEGDIWTDPTMDTEKWSKTLRDYDFVVLYITTESFNKEFSSLFESGVVDPRTVYKIKKLANTVVLSKVE